MIRLVPLSKILPNPFRNEVLNPIDSDKVTQLVESIKTTEEFWEGVYAREAITYAHEGYVELAFGHTRLAAAKQAGLAEIPITIRPMTDGEMLMRMARENVRGELPVMLEAVSAAVKALGEGKIALAPLDPRTRLDFVRYAPSFIPGLSAPSGGPDTPNASSPNAYTADSLAQFLGGMYVKSTGRAQDSVAAALGILELEERRLPGFSESVLISNEEGEKKYKGAKKVISIVSDIKKRHETTLATRNKSAEEQALYHAEQLKLEEERRERLREERRAEIDLARSIAEAEREGNQEKEEKLAKEREEKRADSEKRKLLDKERKEELDKKVAESVRCTEVANQAEKDLPTRMQVKGLLGKLRLIVSEGYALRAEIKAVAHNKNISIQERQLLWQAAQDAGDWFAFWVSGQFSTPPISGAVELQGMREREESKKRRKA
jgi:hypothetical protein